MKKIVSVTAVVFCMMLVSTGLRAEKKNIKVSEFSIPSNPNYYVVNGQGEMVTYKYSTAGDKIDPTSITFMFFNKTGEIRTSGSIGLIKEGGNYFTNDDDLTAFSILALERNIALVEYELKGSVRKAMAFRLVNNYATPTPNKNNPWRWTISINQQYGFANNLVSCYTFANLVNVIFRSRTDNVVTLTTKDSHNLNPGDLVTVTGVSDLGYNMKSVQVISTPTFTTFTYLGEGANEAETSTNGNIFFANILDQIDVYNINGALQKNKGIDNGSIDSWGYLYVINPPVQKYYMGINNTNDKIYVLRP